MPRRPAGWSPTCPLLTGRQKVILGVFFLAFAIMIYGFVPWNDVMDTIFGADWPFPTFATFYFAEARSSSSSPP